MKPPKLWDGPSPVGEALARALNKTDVPYLSATDGQGTWVHKKIGLIEVMGKKPEADVESVGWYCVGYEGERGTLSFTVMGSRRGTGTFRKTGEVSSPSFWQSSLKRYANFAALYLGFGWMTVPATASPAPESGGFFTSISRNGRSAKDFLVVDTGQTMFSPQSIARIGYYLPLGKTDIYGAESGARWLLGMVTTRTIRLGNVITTAPAVAFTEKRQGEWETRTLTVPDGEGWGVQPPQTISEGVALVCCFRTLQLDKYKYSGGAYFENNFDPAQHMLLRLSDGPALAAVDAGELFDFYHPPVVGSYCQNKYDTYAGGSPASEWLRRYNDAYIASPCAQVRIGRLDDGRTVALNLAWFYDRRYLPDEYNDGNLAYYDSVSLVPRDSTTHETEESLAAFGKVAVFVGTEDGGFSRIDNLDHADRFGLIFDPLVVGKYTVFKLAPQTAAWDFPGESGQTAAVAVFTTNGGGALEVNVYDLPFPPHRCGELTAIDEKTLGLMAYGEDDDGELGYHFYETKIVEDGPPFGSEWAWRATVNDRADPPAQYGASETTRAFNPAVARDRKPLPYMDNFNRVVFIRRDDFPAPLTPGALWLSDASKQKPWEP